MPAVPNKFQTVDGYIVTFPEAVQETLKKIRETIQAAAPEAAEVISYQMPAYSYNKKAIIFFAAYKRHYSITIPHPAKVYEAFREEFAGCDISKSTIRFSLDQPFPFDFLSEVTKFLVKEN